jgi:osmotically-inducible protein OsmY
MHRSIVLILVGLTAWLGACAPSDRGLLAAVSAKVATDPSTRDANIEVSVEEGVVRLHGTTNDRDEQSRAMEMTAGVRGVERVVNDMRISDAAIADGVRRALAADPGIGHISIFVAVENGLVLLSSADTTAADRKQAVALASRIDGVTRVGDLMR